MLQRGPVHACPEPLKAVLPAGTRPPTPSALPAPPWRSSLRAPWGL